MPRSFHHQFRLSAAWLALLATLMIYLAPLVSKQLVSKQPTTPAQVHQSAAHHEHHSPAAGDAHPGHEDHHAHEACGYCTLLGQLLWCGFAPPTPAIVPAGPSLAPFASHSPLLVRGHAPFQPRAPPLS